MSTPKIRIGKTDSQWNCIPFSESFDYLKNNSLSRAELSEKGTVKNVHYGDILIKFGECIDTKVDLLPFVKDEAVAKSLIKSCAIKNGDIIFADAAEDNTVGKCSEIISTTEDLIVSGLHTIAVRPAFDFSSRYLGYFLNSPSYHNQLLPHIQGTKISSISKTAIKSTFINYPIDLIEQQAIASYFTSLDKQIEATSKKIESLKRVKAASLQSMFPQEGETKPRVRFKGFEVDWVICGMGDIFNERIESNIYGEMLSVTTSQGIIKASDNGRHDNSNSDKSHYKVVMIGDIAYNSMRMWQGASGVSAYEGIVSPAYTVVYPSKNNIHPIFFGYLFKTTFAISIFKLNSQGLTSDTWNLKYPAFSKLSFLIPKDIDEQQKIAEYFTSLDKQIKLSTQQLEKLKQIKTACLDKMFV